jgi:hypothetical protein
MKPLQNFREVLKSLKYRKPTKIFCPRCCSPKIKLNSNFDVWLTPAKYLCTECGYMDPIVMELEKEEENSEQAPSQEAPDSTASSKSCSGSSQ